MHFSFNLTEKIAESINKDSFFIMKNSFKQLNSSAQFSPDKKINLIRLWKGCKKCKLKKTYMVESSWKGHYIRSYT